ncbi:hypothetical protein J6590_105055 [Homalodisca vitripennis]|nr:hypothetical protein J6590_105055 [Homalodisca vitripennis]
MLLCTYLVGVFSLKTGSTRELCACNWNNSTFRVGKFGVGAASCRDPMIEEYTQAQHLERRGGCSLPGSPLKLGRVEHSIPQMSLRYNRCQEFALNEFVAEVVGPLQTHIDSKFQE